MNCLASTIVEHKTGMKPRFTCYFSCPCGAESSLSDDVLETERALTGEPLPFAPATQVLSVGPLGVHVTLRPGAAATGFVALLDEGGKKKKTNKTKLYILAHKGSV